MSAQTKIIDKARNLQSLGVELIIFSSEGSQWSCWAEMCF